MPAAGIAHYCVSSWISSSSLVQPWVLLLETDPLLQTGLADWTCNSAQSRIPCSGIPSKQETQLCLKGQCLLEVRELAGYSASCYLWHRNEG